MRPDKARLNGGGLGAMLLASLLTLSMPAFAQSGGQETKTPPPQREKPPVASDNRRPLPAPAPFKPAEEVSPSRKLSYPNDM